MQSVQRGVGATWTDAILAVVGPATAVVVVPACHWLDGRELDLLRVALAARAVGANLRERGLGDWVAAADHPHLCALRPPRVDVPDCQQLVDFLATQHIIAAARGSTVRISPYAHNSDGDADQLANALAAWQRFSAPARPSRKRRGP